MLGCRSQQTLDGWVGPRLRPDSSERGMAACQWWLLSLARLPSAGFARVVFGSLGAATRPTPLRRSDQTHFVYGAVSGVISPLTMTRPGSSSMPSA